ncbi:hypothetical protein DLM_0414 [Aquitalea magnusonii]|uniref:Uncharacterized protein n=1 Tax=Aquitalea magnusonii TaxID=332411 RepID=A0A3G9GES8_9NEIS|nr:HEPN domain-containing protein [Aquitalea magnusonii]BBF84086.1 hypothetical protein DLM_0414 [Aquitalea magnusonii]
MNIIYHTNIRLDGLKMNKNSSEKLIFICNRTLSNCDVYFRKNKNILIPKNEDVAILSTFISGDLLPEHKRRVIEDEIHHLITDDIKSELTNTEDSNKRKLSEIEIISLAKALHSRITSYPNKYKITVPICTAKNIAFKNTVKISNNIEFHPSKDTNGEDTSNISFIYTGAIGGYDFSEVEDYIGTCIYILRMLGILRANFSNLRYMFEKRNDEYTIQNITCNRIIANLIQPAHLFHFHHNLNLNNSSINKENELLLTKYFSINETHATQINNSIKWQIEANSNLNSFGIIQTSIALETLFTRPEDNENNATSIKRILASRCAYSAKNKTERDRVYHNILSLYDLRNKIVHGKKVKLNKEDIMTLRIARDILKGVTENEIRALCNS